MKNGFSLNLLVEFTQVFDEEPKTLEAYLTGISRSSLLMAASFLLGFNNKKSKYAKHTEFLSMFFRKENIDIANQIYVKLEALKKTQNSNLIIVNPLSILQLFEFCFNNLTDDESQTGAEIEVNIFKAILYLNEKNTELQNRAFDSTRNVEGSLRMSAIYLSLSFAYSDIVNYDILEVLTSQIIKSIYLFEFLESNQKANILLQKFLEYFGCADWKSFLLMVLPLTTPVFQVRREAHTDIIVQDGMDFDSDCEFIEKLLLKENALFDNSDFKKIRSKPFYRIKKGVYRIIYDLFVVELIHKGLYFKLNEINGALNTGVKISNFRSFYCDDFSERYLVYRVLNSIYQDRYVEFSGTKIKEYNIEAEPDYYIRNGNNLLLFESKDILFNAEIKPTYNFNQYEAEFKKKLYFDEKNGKIERKAVLQLVHNIERILTKQFTFDNNYKSRSLHIYPVIILHDRLFNVVGLNVLVNSWFKIEVEKLKEKGLEIGKIKPITMIDIDTFIFYQDVFSGRTLKLETVIDSYFDFITISPKQKFKDDEHLNSFLNRTILPFSIFLSNYLADKKIVPFPKMLKAKGFSLFD